jgi:uncharacterized protein
MRWFKRFLWSVLAVAVLLTAVGGVGFWYVNRHGGTEISDVGLAALFYAPPGVKHHTAVIVLGGSSGGYPYDGVAQALSDAGYPTLGLAYFQNFMKQPRGVPEHLSEIPLEYFFRAVEWMKLRPEVDPNKIVLMGESRGGELVLLLASLRSDVAGVVAYSPSHVVWGGVEPTWSKSAWTLDRVPLPYVKTRYVGGEPLLTMFNRALAEAPAEQLQAAAIPVERIRGPVLLISSKSDKLWPSAAMSDTIEMRLLQNRFAYAVRNVQYEDSSHLLMGSGPGIVKMGIPLLFQTDFGGSPEGTRKARDAGWAEAMVFLAKIEGGSQDAPATN